LPQAPSPVSASPGQIATDSTPLPLGSKFPPAKRLQAPGLPVPGLPVPGIEAPLLFRETTTPSAAPAAEKRLGLTLAEAIALAQRNHPRLQEASAITQRATAAARVAHAYTNPSLEIYEGQQYARPVGVPGLPGLLQHYAGYQAIEIPPERHARQRAAQFFVSSSRSAEQSVALSVVGDTKHAFYNALRRREEIDHAQENLQLVDDLRRRVEVSVNVGEEGRLELTRAEAELGRARFAVTSAQLEFANAIALLRVTIAGAGDADLDPQGEFEARIALPPLKQLRDHVLETHPVLAASQANIQATLATLDRERALRIPQPVAFAEFENQPDLRFWRTGFNVPIPLWDRRQGQIGEAKAATSQASAVLYQRTLELVSALERAYEQYQLADQQATSLESGSLRAAVSAVDAAKAAYRFGERGIVEVLDAQRVLQSVRGDLLDAQFARQSALVDLEELGAIAPGVRP
jgi:outer membrane protein, heavy metal efflux system